MKRKYKWLLAAVIILISGSAYAVSMMKPVEVEAETVQPGDLENSFTVQGSLVPKDSTVLNAGSNGEVLELESQAGKLMEAGSVIARIGNGQNATLDLQREQYRQQLTTAKKQFDTLFGENGSAISQEDAAGSQYNLAEKNYNNAKSLADQGGFVSQSELNTLRTQMDVAREAYSQAKEANSADSKAYYQQQVTSAQKQLDTMESTVKEETLMMPYRGIVWETYTSTGAYVAQNQAVLRIYEPGNLKLIASLLAEDAVLLTEGTTATVSYANGITVNGTVTFIPQVASQQLSSVGLEENRCSVELEPENIPEGIGAGYEADVTFRLVKAAQVISVPTAALVTLGNGSAVYAIKDNKAVLVSVETGEKSGGRIQILSGLSEGEKIVTDPYGAGIKEGSRVAAES